MRGLSFGLIWVGGLLAAGYVCRAQTAAPTGPAYVGPRFPGGPDSLRALLARCTRQAAAGVTGRAFVRVEFDPAGQAAAYKLLVPPRGGVSPLLAGAVDQSVGRLKASMPAWQLPPPAPNAQEAPSAVLLFEFGGGALLAPLLYAEQEADFQGLKARLPAYTQRYPRVDQLDDPGTPLARRLVTFAQLQTRYPVDALRNRHQGRVYAYFEVSETGALEHAQVVGSAGPYLDAEALRALRQLPAPSGPPRLRGQPVRVYYTVPVTFKLQ